MVGSRKSLPSEIKHFEKTTPKTSRRLTWGKQNTMAEIYPPGNDHISHQTGKFGKSIDFKSADFFNGIYDRSLEGMLASFVKFTTKNPTLLNWRNSGFLTST